MAGADYVHCAGCWERLFYIGHRDVGEDFSKVYCEKCYKKLEKKILKQEKAAKRGR